MKVFHLLIAVCLMLSFSCKKGEERKVIPGAYNRVLILGNSITHSKPDAAIGWYGDWGMAASTKEKDFVHLLKERFEKANSNVKFDFRNIADYEVNYYNYPYGRLDSLKNLKPDLLILRIGENVRVDDLSKYDLKTHYLELIDYFKANNPQMKVICAANFWVQEPMEVEIREACMERKLPLVVLSDLSLKPNHTAAGLFAHAGVASHPSDIGMAAIAERIWGGVLALR